MKRVLGIVLLAGVTAGLAYGVAVTEREASYGRFVEQGDAALGRDDSSAAIEAFSVAISLKEDSMAAYLKRGEAYRRRGEFDASVRDLRRAAQIDSLSIYPRELLGDVHYAVGAAAGAGARIRFDTAADQYREAVALDDKSARLQYKLGLASYRAGQLTGAIPALRQAISLDPRFAEAHYVLGICLRLTGQPQEAVRALERAVALAPTLVPARDELVDLYADLRRYDARLTHLVALTGLEPGAPRERALAFGYMRAGHLDRAVGQLASAAKRYPDDMENYVALGRLWLRRATPGGRVELGKAFAALSKSVSTESTSEALTLLGRAYMMAGDAARAEGTLQEAVTRFPVEPDAFLSLADVAQRRGHLEIAHRALRDYSALVPPDALPGALLARIGEAHLQAGDDIAARRAIDAALAREPSNALAAALKRRLAGS